MPLLQPLDSSTLAVLEALGDLWTKIDDTVPKALEWVEHHQSDPKGIVLPGGSKVGNKLDRPRQQEGSHVQKSLPPDGIAQSEVSITVGMVGRECEPGIVCVWSGLRCCCT